MARTPIGVAGITKTGVAAPQQEAADPVNGNSVTNSDGQTVLVLGNVGTAARTLAVQVTAAVDGQPVNARTLTVPAGAQVLAGPFPYWWYGTTLLLDPSSADLRISALRSGEGLPVPDPAAAFAVSGMVVVANPAYPGVTAAGQILTVDTATAPATASGNVLTVTAV